MNTVNYKLSDADFIRLGNFIYSNYGIKMPPMKKSMLEARLQKRLRANNFSSFHEYCEFVFSRKEGEQEVAHMIDVVSTNKTDFFREAPHFDFLLSDVLPEFCGQENNKRLKIWSAACSSGEEIYTLAMVISEFISKKNKFDYSILGTDISFSVLEKALLGIYPLANVSPIPLPLRSKYLLRSKNPESNTVRIIPELRSKASFQRLNLMEPSYPVPADFDIIFCRNVLIYFDRETQGQVIRKLCSHLKPGGYFFLGHSESAMGSHDCLAPIRPTIYRKTE
jgi:chemotaxis protein methyltransferase CheR